MKQNLINLIKVKSIVTIMLTITFTVLSIRRDLDGEQFIMIFSTVIAFYFGTQSEKNKGG